MDDSPLYQAAVLTSDASLGKQLRDSLASAEIVGRVFPTASSFKDAFGKGFRSVYVENSVNPTPYAEQRPELIIVDFDSHVSGDPFEPGRTILGARPETEILVLRSSPSREDEHFAELIRSGMGTIVDRTTCRDPIRHFHREARRLCEISCQRKEARLRRSICFFPDRIRRSSSVFLSHAHLDEVYSHGIRRLFEAEGILPWYSFKDGANDETWRYRLNGAIADSRYFVCLVTEQYLESTMCEDERELFVMQSDCRRRHHLVTIPPPEFFDGIENTSQGIRKFLDRWPPLKIGPHTFKDYLFVLMEAVKYNLL